MVVAIAKDFIEDPEYALVNQYLESIEDEGIRNYTIMLAREQSILTAKAVEERKRKFVCSFDTSGFDNIEKDAKNSIAATLIHKATSPEERAHILDDLNKAQEHACRLLNIHRVGVAEAYSQNTERKKDGWETVLEYYHNDPDALIAAVGETHPTSITDTPHPTSQYHRDSVEQINFLLQARKNWRLGYISDEEFNQRAEKSNGVYKILDDFSESEAVRVKARTPLAEGDVAMLYSDRMMIGLEEALHSTFDRTVAFYQERNIPFNDRQKRALLEQLEDKLLRSKTWALLDTDGNTVIKKIEDQLEGLNDFNAHHLLQLDMAMDNDAFPTVLKARIRAILKETRIKMERDIENESFTIEPIPVAAISNLINDWRDTNPRFYSNEQKAVSTLMAVLKSTNLGGHAQKREGSSTFHATLNVLLNKADIDLRVTPESIADGSFLQQLTALETDNTQTDQLERLKQAAVDFYRESPEDGNEDTRGEFKSLMLMLARPQQVRSVVMADAQGLADIRTVSALKQLAVHVLKETGLAPNAKPSTLRIQPLVERAEHIRDFKAQMREAFRDPVFVRRFLDENKEHNKDLLRFIYMIARSDTARAGGTLASEAAFAQAIADNADPVLLEELKVLMMETVNKFPETFSDLQEDSAELAEYKRMANKLPFEIQICVGKAFSDDARGGGFSPTDDLYDYPPLNKPRYLMQGIDAITAVYMNDLVAAGVSQQIIISNDPKHAEQLAIHRELHKNEFFVDQINLGLDNYQKVVFNEELEDTEFPNKNTKYVLENAGFDLNALFNVSSRSISKGSGSNEVVVKKARAITFANTLMLIMGHATYAVDGEAWQQSLENLRNKVIANPESYPALRSKLEDADLNDTASFARKMVTLDPTIAREAKLLSRITAKLDLEFGWKRLFKEELPNTEELKILEEGGEGVDPYKAATAKMFLKIQKTAEITYSALKDDKMKPAATSVQQACDTVRHDIYHELEGKHAEYKHNIRDLWAILDEFDYPKKKLFKTSKDDPVGSYMSADELKLLRMKGAMLYGQVFDMLLSTILDNERSLPPRDAAANDNEVLAIETVVNARAAQM
jgi:hypothetical protein